MLSSSISIPVSKPVIIPLMCLWPNYESVHMFSVPHLLWFLSSDSLKFILEIIYWHLSLSLPLSPEYQSIHLLVYHMASWHFLQSSLLLESCPICRQSKRNCLCHFLLLNLWFFSSLSPLGLLRRPFQKAATFFVPHFSNCASYFSLMCLLICFYTGHVKKVSDIQKSYQRLDKAELKDSTGTKSELHRT